MEKKSNEKAIIILTVLLFLALLYFCVNLFWKLRLETVQASSVESKTTELQEVLTNQNPLDIDEILEENRNISLREEMIYEEQDLEFTTQYINNENLPSGTLQVSQLGINGIQDVITIKKYEEDELISEQIVASNIKKASVDKVVEIGTGRRKKSLRIKRRRYRLCNACKPSYYARSRFDK